MTCTITLESVTAPRAILIDQPWKGFWVAGIAFAIFWPFLLPMSNRLPMHTIRTLRGRSLAISKSAQHLVNLNLESKRNNVMNIRDKGARLSNEPRTFIMNCAHVQCSWCCCLEIHYKYTVGRFILVTFVSMYFWILYRCLFSLVSCAFVLRSR